MLRKYSRGEKDENLYQEKWDYLSGWVIEKIPIETGCCRKTKNGAKKVWIEDDVDPTKEKRKRNKHGTAINFPLFVEEFLTIEAVFDNALEAGQTESFADYIREVLKAHAKKELGAKKYEEILSKKYNQKILKKDDKIVSE